MWRNSEQAQFAPCPFTSHWLLPFLLVPLGNGWPPVVGYEHPKWMGKWAFSDCKEIDPRKCYGD